jgi:acyl-coenzyme A thioesterase PaaI-like protein
MHELPHTHSCFVCGESNAIGFRLRFETDGHTVQTRFCPRPEHNGFKGVMHGGLIATVLDEVMVWGCAVATRRFAFCAEFTVRFLSPARPGEPLVATGELTANRKGKIFEAKGTLRDQSGKILAEATGRYLPIKRADAVAMATDFVGDPNWLSVES